MSQLYDPLQHPHCQGQAFAPSYWASTIDLPTAKSSVTSQQQFDVAIIGGGYSGLLTAYHLATEHHLDVCVLEANQVGFGASARNAGFVLKGSGRLSYPQMTEKWGVDVSKGIYAEFSDAVNRVEQLIAKHDIACDKQENGYLKIAHNQNALQTLNAQAEYIQTHLQSSSTPPCQWLSQDELSAHYMKNQQAYGALRYSDSFGVNPLKLLLGYRTAMLESGVTLFENALVENITETASGFQLSVNGCQLSCNKLVIAGNAYNSKLTHKAINNRYLPILSSIFVSKPLTAKQLAESGLQTNQVCMDTRTLKYYYRLLPDNRLLFGGRGAVYAKHQNKSVYLANLKKGLSDCFPSLANIEHDYYWNGFIAAALDDMPHINFDGKLGFILGYCGAGVSFSAQAGYRMAQMVAGKTVPNLPLYNTPLPYLPFPHFRRLGQFAYYQYAQVKDRFY
ncbi:MULTISPECIES: NAD(P)/FAD-dependent oxidoreductase [Pseudoalteromonas]|uniref:NAD(P)/FAD-dependent oxidoreductase n=1 Tax=Pseudoalteromonas TaxID=53246 RepID=UPI00026CCDDF|nr:FAD-dependent oxidoreductase [Pseudoalteromonas spongiae]ATC97688.1 hypothetical protein PSPO_a0476 [Pseudoalteromonas spongiae UST010723-006]